MPFLGKGGAVIRIRNALGVEQRKERGDIIGAKGDVAAFHRVDHLAIVKGHAQVLFRQMHLHRAIRCEPDFARIALAILGLGTRKRRDRNIVQSQHVGIEIVQPVDVLGHIVDMVKFQLHNRLACCVGAKPSTIADPAKRPVAAH